MNKKQPISNRLRQADYSFIPRLVLLALFFFVGVILGQVLSGQIPATTGDELSRYLSDYIALGGELTVTGKTAVSALVIYLRYPLLAFLLGFASVGIVLIPCLSIAYGFFLSFSVCCFTATFGSDGVLLAVAVFGLRCLITLPFYFLLAAPALNTSAAFAAVSFGRERRALPVAYDRKGWMRLCVCLVILLLGVCVDLFLSPYFLRMILGRILL